MRLPRFDVFFLNKLVLALFDTIALALAYLLSFTLRGYYLRQFGLIYEPTIWHFYLLCVLAVLILLFFRNQHLYRDVAFRRSTEHLILLTQSWLLFAGMFISLSFFFKVRLFIEHRVTVLLFIVFGWCFLYTGRFLLASQIVGLFMRRLKSGNRILVVGPPDEVVNVSRHVANNRDANHTVVGFLTLDERTEENFAGLPVPCLGSVSELKVVMVQYDISEMFITGFDADWRLIYQVINQARRSGAVVRVALPHFGDIKARAPSLNEIEDGFVYLNNSQLVGLEQAAKRLFDLASSISAIIVFSPLLAIIAAAIRLDSPGTVLFRQARVGLDGKMFTVLKFRTMRQNTEEHHKQAVRHLINGDHEYLTSVSGSGTVLKATLKSEVTLVGQILRKTSLDELPQLFNVLTGEMSLVGPRPLPAYEVEMFTSWQHLRHTIKPGITGFWQAYARSAVSHQEMVMMDIFYAVNWSLSLDIRILIRTFFTMLSGGGAV